MSTESVDPRFSDLDQLETLGILQLMNDEDAGVPRAVRATLPQIAAAVDAIAERMGAGGRLVYVGAGTSGRLATLDAAECPPTFGTPPDLVRALIAGGPQALVSSVEGAEDDVEAGRRDLTATVRPTDAVVGIAASGRTPYVLAAIAAARELGTLTVGVSCNRPAPLLDGVDHPIAVVTGPEVVAGSTRLKAGTAQKLVLNMISTGVMVRLGRVVGNRMVDMTASNQKLRARAVGLVQDALELDAAAARRVLEATGWDIRQALAIRDIRSGTVGSDRGGGPDHDQG